VAFAVGDAGAAWRVKSAITAAAREGARVASLTPNLQIDDAAVLQVVVDPILTGAGVELNRTTRSVRFETLAVGQPVTVEVIHRFEPLLLSLVPAFEDAISLAASSTMRYEGTGRTVP